MKKLSCFIGVTAMLIVGLSAKIVAQPNEENTVTASHKVSVIHKHIQTDTTDQLQGSGLMGYITSKAPQPASGYGAGVGFYVAVYPILPEPIADFQIGLASTWIIPKNAGDGAARALCDFILESQNLVPAILKKWGVTP